MPIARSRCAPWQGHLHHPVLHDGDGVGATDQISARPDDAQGVVGIIERDRPIDVLDGVFVDSAVKAPMNELERAANAVLHHQRAHTGIEATVQVLASQYAKLAAFLYRHVARRDYTELQPSAPVR